MQPCYATYPMSNHDVQRLHGKRCTPRLRGKVATCLSAFSVVNVFVYINTYVQSPPWHSTPQVHLPHPHNRPPRRSAKSLECTCGWDTCTEQNILNLIWLSLMKYIQEMYYKTKNSDSLRYFNTCFMHNKGGVFRRRIFILISSSNEDWRVSWVESYSKPAMLILLKWCLMSCLVFQ